MDIKLLKKLREQTSAGMLECKSALEKFDDDYDQALSHIKSQVKEETTTNRVASKGMCKLEIKDDEAILFEVNAETDFVTKNEHFLSLVDTLASHLIDTNVVNANSALKVLIDGQSVDELIKQKSSIISENAYLRRLYRVKKQEGQGFGSYTHMQGKVVSLVVTDKKNDKIANEIAMQITAASAQYLSLENIDQDTINYEKFMYEKEHNTFNEDDFNQSLKAKTLLSQSYIKDPSISVEAYLKLHDINIIDFFRFELGQGIDNKLNCRLDIDCDNSKITVTPIY
ncbi:translation elongation factor Ts [Mariniplasma anaerobium]|uniref:Elongation factor Ts n=1 Tax=Mariniplasma anaerobium TaxID=2735436 RepID=A0A7U9TJI0_9MOLU|nr:translation elongation factor Ts [Mariniplasma anaerobium]BCR36886.1 elongation factor Ts [Mariniplasma anaerobium]